MIHVLREFLEPAGEDGPRGLHPGDALAEQGASPEFAERLVAFHVMTMEPALTMFRTPVVSTAPSKSGSISNESGSTWDRSISSRTSHA